MRIGKTFGLDPWEISRKWTHRQYVVTLEFLKQEWNNPGLTEHYLMGVSTEVRRVLSRNPGRIKLDDFKLKFDLGDRPKLSPEELTRQAKQRWFGHLKILDKLPPESV